MDADLPNRCKSVLGEVSGFVMAGGASSRMGSSKADLPWNSAAGAKKTLLDHAIDRLRQVCASVQVCIGQQSDPQVSVPFIFDALPGAGPLGGVVAALEQSMTDWNIFLAVDLPLVPVIFLHSLLARILIEGEGRLAVVPVLDGRPQPLCSLLHRSLAPELRQVLTAGKYKLMYAIETAAAQAAAGYPTAPALELWEIQHLKGAGILEPQEWFLNVNTPSDWQLAQKLAAQERALRL